MARADIDTGKMGDVTPDVNQNEGIDSQPA